MIYGAYGYTGMLIAEEAVRRGHKPVLAGRAQEKLVPFAKRLGLDWVVFDLQDEQRLKGIIQNFTLVFNAAGPFTHTCEPMVRACLDTKTNCVDIAGELTVLEHILSLDQQARRKDIVLIPGLGFDVIATDCMARYVAEKINDPTQLEIATVTSITSKPSPGTIRSILDIVSKGTIARRQRQLVKIPVGLGEKRIRFIDQERTVLPVTLGDLVTAYRTTGIPDITTFVGFSEREATLYKRTQPLYRRLFSFAPLRRLVQKQTSKLARGPDEHMRRTNRSQVWVCARNKKGVERHAWLETIEAYQFTAVAGVLCVEKLLINDFHGALTPGLAFGADLVLNIPGSTRVDTI